MQRCSEISGAVIGREKCLVSSIDGDLPLGEPLGELSSAAVSLSVHTALMASVISVRAVLLIGAGNGDLAVVFIFERRAKESNPAS
tara:strand:+ start:774 stop:1031 length:258 start_codon:yes stop_codon:yes gene_type:complete